MCLKQTVDSRFLLLWSLTLGLHFPSLMEKEGKNSVRQLPYNSHAGEAASVLRQLRYCCSQHRVFHSISDLQGCVLQVWSPGPSAFITQVSPQAARSVYLLCKMGHSPEYWVWGELLLQQPQEILFPDCRLLPLMLTQPVPARVVLSPGSKTSRKSFKAEVALCARDLQRGLVSHC